MQGSFGPFFKDVNQPAYRFPPLERGLDIGVGEMPAALITHSGTMTMDSAKPVCFLSEGCSFRAGDTAFCWLDSGCISDMIDRSYAGYQEVPFVTPEPVDGREVLVGVSFAALPAEIAD